MISLLGTRITEGMMAIPRTTASEEMTVQEGMTEIIRTTRAMITTAATMDTAEMTDTTDHQEMKSTPETLHPGTITVEDINYNNFNRLI